MPIIELVHRSKAIFNHILYSKAFDIFIFYVFENVMDNGANGQWSICSIGANAPSFIAFSSLFKTYLNFYIFFNVV